MLTPDTPRNPRTVLVAGGAGFVGSHLCEALLAKGANVICVDNFMTGSRANIDHLTEHPGFSLLEHDVCDDLQVPRCVDQVYNLACAASPTHYQADPVHTILTCVLGTWNLLKLASTHDARFLQASTSEIYGDPDVHPQVETYVGSVNCTGPRACYDEGKRAAEALCFDALRQNDVDTRVARIFNTYGTRMRPDDGRIISNFAVQALSGEPLTVYGSGKQTRSFCYVSDLVDGLMRLMELEDNPGAPVNLGNPGEFSILELAELVCRQTGTRAGLVFRPLPQDDPKRRRPDISRAWNLLEWRPQVPLEEGLAQTIDYFRSIQPQPAGKPRTHRGARALTADEDSLIRIERSRPHA